MSNQITLVKDTRKLVVQTARTLVDSGVKSLQGAYDGGNAIITDGSGPVALSRVLDDATSVMTLDMSPAIGGSGSALAITMGANATGAGLAIANGGAGPDVLWGTSRLEGESIYLAEKGNANDDVVGLGQLWAKTGSELWFTGPDGIDVRIDAGVHGALSNLGADDHTQYLLVDGTRAVAGRLSIAPAAQTSGVSEDLLYAAPAHAGLTASTEVPSVLFDMSATKTWATGAIASQSAFKILAPTLAFAGASVVTDATTLYIDAAPVAGPNATITNPYVIQAAPDTDAAFIFGKLRIDSRVSDYSYIGHYDRAGATEYCISIPPNGNMALNAATALPVRMSGSSRFYFEGTTFRANHANGMSIPYDAATASTPSFAPDRADATSGISNGGTTGEVSVITGATEAARWDASQNQVNAGNIYAPSNVVAYSFSAATATGIYHSSVSGSVLLLTGSNGIEVTTSGLLKTSAPNTLQSETPIIELANATAAVADTVAPDGQQYSPMLVFEGQGWKTAATAASQEVLMAAQLHTVQGVANPTGELVFKSNVNGAGYSDVAKITSDGELLMPGTALSPASPDYGFAAQAGMGMYRAGTSVLRFAVGSLYKLSLTGTQAQLNFTRSSTVPALALAGDIDCGLGFPATNEVSVITGGTEAANWDASQVMTAASHINPDTDSANDLGLTGTRWRELFVDDITMTADINIGGALNHDGGTVGFHGATPVAQSLAYARNAAIVTSRTLLASASATVANNNNVLAALIEDLQATGLLG